jgi:hypothetical protein
MNEFASCVTGHSYDISTFLLLFTIILQYIFDIKQKGTNHMIFSYELKLKLTTYRGTLFGI